MIRVTVRVIRLTLRHTGGTMNVWPKIPTHQQVLAVAERAARRAASRPSRGTQMLGRPV